MLESSSDSSIALHTSPHSCSRVFENLKHVPGE